MGTLQYDAAPAPPRAVGLWNVAWRVALGAILADVAIGGLTIFADWLGLVARPDSGFATHALNRAPFEATNAWGAIANVAAWGAVACVVTFVVTGVVAGAGRRVSARRVFLILLFVGPPLFGAGHPASAGRATVAWIVASLLVWRFALVDEAWPQRRQAVVIGCVFAALVAVVAPYGVTHPLTLAVEAPSVIRVTPGGVVQTRFELKNAGFAGVRVTDVRPADPWPFVHTASASASAAFSMPGHSAAQVALRMRGCSPGSRFTLDSVLVDYRVLGLDFTAPVRLDSPLSYRCS